MSNRCLGDCHAYRLQYLRTKAHEMGDWCALSKPLLLSSGSTQLVFRRRP